MKQTNVDVSSGVTRPQIVQHRRFVEICHVGHVLYPLELGRVHLLDHILLDCLFLHNTAHPTVS